MAFDSAEIPLLWFIMTLLLVAISKLWIDKRTQKTTSVAVGLKVGPGYRC